jgi:DNA-binding CsgD family transcriptional regulator
MPALSVTTQRRATHAVRNVAETATGLRELLEGAGQVLREVLAADGSFVCTTDPVSGIFNAEAVVWGLPDAMRAPWMVNEFLHDDLNRFVDLQRDGIAVASLHDAIRRTGRSSSRDTEVNARFGYGPELRANCAQGDAFWGAVNLVRFAEAEEFTAAEQQWLGSVTPYIAEGIRRLVLDRTLLGPDTIEPGVIMLDAHGRIVSQSETAPTLLDDLFIAAFDGGPDDELPCQAVSVALSARARALNAASAREPVSRVQGRSGHWLTLRGTHTVDAAGELAYIALTIEPGRPEDIMAMIAVAYRLTAREQEVFAELRRGGSIEETAERMFISPHTVRTHVRSLFAKTGCTSRGELMSRLYVHREAA